LLNYLGPRLRGDDLFGAGCYSHLDFQQDTNSMQAYNQIPYRSVALPQTHPDRLATHARLFGLGPAPLADCRVLDVGCGDGANLLAMAGMLPESTFVGIDSAEVPIAEGRERAEDWGLANLDLRALDLLDLPSDFGPFDYIVAHGVYSWVPDAVRDGLMALIAGHLAPHGVAFVSYNALPGGHLRRLTREMMRYHIDGLEAPDERVGQARAILDFLIDGQPEESTYLAMLEDERDRCARYTDEHFFHDHIADVNRPFYFHEVVAHADRHGLRYLAEADFAAMQDRTFPPQTRAVLDQLGGDRLRREQVLDFLRNRMFRQTLLCHADAPVQSAPSSSAVRALTIAAPIRETERDKATGVRTFESEPGKAIRTDHPFARAVCEHIGAAWPRALPFADLWAAVESAGGEGITPDVLAQMLLDFYGDGFIHLHTIAPTLTGKVSDRPEALPIARREAEEGEVVTNGWHRSIPLDAAEQRVLPLLDGQRNHADLLDALGEAEGEPPVTDEALETMLHRFAQHALLVA
jgi:methyltransferase-like protein/protein-L-isoaspartate O-methyltransferase